MNNLTCEIGEDRIPESAPLPSTLIDIQKALSQVSKKDSFISACQQVTRYSFDHPGAVGTLENTKNLFSALSPGAMNSQPGILTLSICVKIFYVLFRTLFFKQNNSTASADLRVRTGCSCFRECGLAEERFVDFSVFKMRAGTETFGPASKALASLLLQVSMRRCLREQKWVDTIISCLGLHEKDPGAIPFLSLLLNILADQVRSKPVENVLCMKKENRIDACPRASIGKGPELTKIMISVFFKIK